MIHVTTTALLIFFMKALRNLATTIALSTGCSTEPLVYQDPAARYCDEAKELFADVNLGITPTDGCNEIRKALDHAEIGLELMKDFCKAPPPEVFFENLTTVRAKVSATCPELSVDQDDLWERQ